MSETKSSHVAVFHLNKYTQWCSVVKCDIAVADDDDGIFNLIALVCKFILRGDNKAAVADMS